MVPYEKRNCLNCKHKSTDKCRTCAKNTTSESEYPYCWELLEENKGTHGGILSGTNDIVNKPSHYHRNEIDVNYMLEKHFPKEGGYTVYEGFLIGNIIKYVCRHKDKNGLQDLEKAEYNLKELMRLAKERASK